MKILFVIQEMEKMDDCNKFLKEVTNDTIAVQKVTTLTPEISFLISDAKLLFLSKLISKAEEMKILYRLVFIGKPGEEIIRPAYRD